MLLLFRVSAGAGAVDEWQRLMDAGTLVYGQARYKKAEQLFLTESQVVEQFNFTDDRKAGTFNHLGPACPRTGFVGRSKAAVRTGAGDSAADTGHDHPMVGMVLDRYTALFRALGQRSRAGLMATRATVIRARQST